MRSRDRLGDRRQGRIVCSGIFKAIVRDGHGVRATMPLAEKTSARLQAKIWGGANSTGLLQGLHYRLQLATCRFAQPAMFELLEFVTERENKEVAADLWRCAVMQPSPFTAQLVDAERPNAVDLALDRSSSGFRHLYAADEAGALAFDLDLGALAAVT